MRDMTRPAALAAAMLALAPAAGQTYDPRYPVCIEVYSLDGSAITCAFTTMAQCKATASGQAAQCCANPYAGQIRPPATPRPRRSG